MKKILFFILLIVSIQSFGQDPTGYQHRIVRERIQGSFMVDSTQHLPRYNTTPSGVRVGGSVQSGAVGIDTINHVGFFYSGDKWRNFGSLSFETRLLNGGIVTWDSVLKFAISPATYYINGAFNSSSETHVTLDAADATLNRIDLIYLDSTGAHKLSGDAATTPAEPNLPPNAIRLTAIQVDALATAPSTVDTLIIYDENVEWVGAATSVTTNFAGTTSPCHFTKTTDLGAVTSASYIQYTATSPIKISKYTVLKFNLTLKAAFAQGTQLQLSWRRAGVLKSTTINIASGNYGYLRTSSGCQNITIPISAWSFLSDSIDQIRFQFTGSNSSGCYIDWVQLQEGISQNQPGTGQRFGVSGEDAVASQNRYFNMKNQYFYHLDSVASFVFTATDTRFKNISGTDWLSYVTSTKKITLSDSVYLSEKIPYSSSASIVHIGIDTNSASPTYLKLVRKTSSGGGGTINSGTTGKPAYYVGSTTLDDFPAVDYALTGANQIITAQNTTDTNLVLKGVSVQTAPFFAVRNSAGTVLTQITKDGYGIFPAGTSTTLPISMNGTTGFFDYGGGIGVGIYSSGSFRTFIGEAGIAMRDQSTAIIDFGNLGLYSTTNNMRITAPSEGVIKFQSQGLTAANVINGTAGENTSSSLYLVADEGDDAADTWKITSETGNDLTFTNNTTEVARFLSGKGLTMPEQTAPGTPAANFTSIYPKSDGLWYGKDDAGVETKLSNGSFQKGAFLESPTSTDTIDVWQTPVAITITSLKTILRGTSSPSVTFNIGFGTSIQSPTAVFTADITCASVTTGCSNSSGFNDATIPAGSFIWIYTNAASGTIRSISFTINYTED